MSEKRTCTSVFLVPYLLQSRAKRDSLGYIEGYIKDENRDIDYKNPVYVLFKPTDQGKFEDFLSDEKTRCEYLVDDYDYPDGYTVLVYEFPLENDYKLFLEGKYSKMSKEYKEGIPKRVKVVMNGLPKEELSLPWRVCNKTEDLRKYWEKKLDTDMQDMEYYRIPELETETLKL